MKTLYAFDVSLPFFASTRITVGGQTFRDGDPLPWRELGISERVLFAWWQASLVRCEPVATSVVDEAPAPAIADAREEPRLLSRAERKALRRAAG